MLITEHFIFLHLPKTGGTFVERAVKHVLELPVLYEARHDAFIRLPSQFSHLPTIGVWRDPWSFYASLFHFAQAGMNHHTSMFIALASNGYQLDFGTTTMRLINLDESLISAYEEKIASYTGPVPDFLCLDVHSLREAKSLGLGLYGYLVHKIFPPNAQLTYPWQQTHLRSDMMRYFSGLGLPRDKIQKLLLMKEQNVSPGYHLGALYTPSLAKLIAHSEAPLIATHRLTPPPSIAHLLS